MSDEMVVFNISHNEDGSSEVEMTDVSLESATTIWIRLTCLLADVESGNVVTKACKEFVDRQIKITESNLEEN